MIDTAIAAQQALSGQRRGLRAVTPFLGPAFIACVAYVDPGNFATNMAGGAQFGYALGWVVLGANLMAMLVQTLSAKLGIATGKSLPEVCRDRLDRRVVVFLWLQAEAVAMATDLAEFTGAALGLHLVFGLPLWTSALLAGLAAFAVLAMEVGGFRRLEAAITALVGVVVVAFCLELRSPGPRPPRSPRASSRRGCPGSGAARRLHRRRDRDAARHLPALGAGPRPGAVNISETRDGACSASRSSTCCAPWAWPG